MYLLVLLSPEVQEHHGHCQHTHIYFRVSPIMIYSLEQEIISLCLVLKLFLEHKYVSKNVEESGEKTRRSN